MAPEIVLSREEIDEIITKVADELNLMQCMKTRTQFQS